MEQVMFWQAEAVSLCLLQLNMAPLGPQGEVGGMETLDALAAGSEVPMIFCTVLSKAALRSERLKVA